ncbi:YkgJ family cysteine cluster protein [Pelagicoccus mobilis]|uniref:YkgJ family cysteine cluster protein n=1 Tax=Pelagicoccus mobilis TaxID=415221 RepID=A0A934RVL1_9BACT|nr:YkgJ family cysteine cluster protein [Pelagicoccus mobilis]MBK1877622.1 YkgJ family cysteine cluster protein [Pelagicoccus mobilis]
MNLGEQLCLACGMCCDGTLFDNVRFGPDESTDDLKALGMPVKRSRAKVPVAFFKQPCRALCGDLKCKVYQDRPQQCRSFECGVFKELAAGETSLESALRVVKKARRKADQARRLLRKMGEEDERSSLGLRLRRVQRQIDSGMIDASAAEAFADLGLVMHQLDLLAHERFYTEEEE